MARLFALLALVVGCSVHTPQEVQGLRSYQQQTAFVGPSSAAVARLQHAIRCSRQQRQQQQYGHLAAARKPFVGGNWKCNGTVEGAEEILQMLNEAPAEVEDVEVVIAPPSLHAGSMLRGLRRPISVALQDGSEVESFGAYTGEINPQMAKDFGIRSVIIGHSERRMGFGGQPGETDEVVAAKAKNAVRNGLQVIACIGESLEARQSGKTMEVLERQLQAFSRVFSPEDWGPVVLAYEPVWAIGTGQTATPQMAQETHREIRDWLKQHVGEETAQNVRIIYGGSVKGSNAKELFAGPDVDGFLVGGASLTSDFHAIIKAAKPTPS